MKAQFNTDKIIAQIQSGDLMKVNRWDYYPYKRKITAQLKKMKLYSEEVEQRLFYLEDSVKETL